MSLLPGLLGLTAGRSFSFYPAIHGVAHNEWRFRRATWSDFVVVNTASGEEACIPHGFVGDVSANSPTVIVGLKREMQWLDGVAVPYRRPVVELPIAVNAVNDYVSVPRLHSRPSSVVSIRLESRPTVKIGRKAVGVVMLSLVVVAIAANATHPGEVRDRLDAMLVSSAWQQLTPNDDYNAVVSKLGAPATQRTYVEPGGRVFRSLDYPDRRFTAILEGPSSEEAHYVASMSVRGRILGDSPPFSAGALRSIPRF